MTRKQILDGVLAFDQAKTVRLVQPELDHGTAARTIVEDGFTAAMESRPPGQHKILGPVKGRGGTSPSWGLAGSTRVGPFQKAEMKG